MHKRKTALLLIAAAAAVLAAGPFYAGEEDAVSSGDESALEAETEGDVITPEDIDLSGYLTEDADSYVTLGDYEGLKVEKEIYEVTDDDVSAQIESTLYDATTLVDVEGDPEEGDIITVDITFTVNGESDSQLDYAVYYGYGDIGDEFDQQMAHARVGDTFNYEETFDEDSYYSEWAGQTVQFSGTVTAVQREEEPELTDEWVQENTDYETVSAYEEAVREQLQEQYDLQSEWNAEYTVIASAMDNCTFNGYPQELYDSCLEESTLYYEDMADIYDLTLDELLEEYGLTEDDLAQEALQTVNTRLFLSAVALKENIEVTQQDVVTLVNDHYEDYGYSDPDSFRLSYGDDYLALTVLENKVGALLISTADVTEVTADPDSYELNESSIYDDEDSLVVEPETEETFLIEAEEGASEADESYEE